MGVQQLLKWIGNKTKYADDIIRLMPEEINNYIEPFLGSGAVLAALLQQSQNGGRVRVNNAIASDALDPLIGIFQLIQEDPETIINYYEETINRFNQDRENIYLEVRDRFNLNRNPLDFLILSRTCYSGIIRFRKNDGYMSTPIGPHNPISPEKFRQRAELWSNLVQNVEFINSDYRQIIDRAGEGDLVYCDPPYTHSQGILYGAQEFKIEELWESIQRAKDRGANIMVSINGQKRSRRENIHAPIPDGLFERQVYIDCGISNINRLQRAGEVMENEEVHDLLLMSW